MKASLTKGAFMEPKINSLISSYKEHGVAYLRNFVASSMLISLLREIELAEDLALRDLVANWGNQKVAFFTKDPESQKTEGKAEDFVTTPYFRKSGRGAHVFFEEIENELVVNRIGHGLHLVPELSAIGELVYNNEALHGILRALGYIKPICLLSVYIPKLANGVGSDVIPHQESSFANTDPLSCLVLWVALEDADVENACMWGLRGSHKWPLKYVSRSPIISEREPTFR